MLRNNSVPWAHAMTDEPDLNRAREQARRAQDDAERLRREAERLRDQVNSDTASAREAAQRLRDEAREAARLARDEASRLRREAREFERRLRETHREAVRGARAATQDAYQDEQAFSLDGITAVNIEQTAGNLTIRQAKPGEDPGVAISSTKGTPKVEVSRTGDQLRINIELKTGWIFRRKQGISALVRVGPNLTDVNANLGYGDIEIRDLAATNIKLNAGAGKITGFATTGAIEAEVGAGRVNLNVHRGLARCRTGTGDVTLDVAGVVPGVYRVDVGIGRIEVRLPPGAPIHVTTSTGMGKTTNRYSGSDENAPSRLVANTGIGELVVRTRDDSASAPPSESSPRPRAGRAPAARRHEVEELRILQLLEQGRISSQEAAELIAALQGAAPPLPDEEAPADPETTSSPD